MRLGLVEGIDLDRLVESTTAQRRPLLLIDIARMDRLVRYCESEEFSETYVSIEFMTEEVINIVDRILSERVFHRIKAVHRFHGEVRAFKRNNLDVFGHDYRVLSTPF